MNRNGLELGQHHLMENSDFKKKKKVPVAFENASRLAQVERKTHVVTNKCTAVHPACDPGLHRPFLDGGYLRYDSQMVVLCNHSVLPVAKEGTADTRPMSVAVPT